MKVSDFDFELPDECIALRPAIPRHSARQMVVAQGSIQDSHVIDMVTNLKAGDLIVFNDTKVIPSYLYARRGEMATEVNLHKRLSPVSWLAFAKKTKRLHVGDKLEFGEGKLTATISAIHDAGEIKLDFDARAGELEGVLAEIGMMPIPPYIASKRRADEQDKQDYQTIFARAEGAVAAPTASLHFTDELLDRLRAKGVRMSYVTLHVGAGTFLPVKVDDTKDHKMHAEWGQVDEQTAALINQTHKEGGRVIAVGTTVLRILESATHEDGIIHPFSGDTAIFITPGYKFRAVDILMTNFHLPKSTLFMLVCAFAGTDRMKQAYAHAIASGYRFYSYGDSCLLFRD